MDTGLQRELEAKVLAGERLSYEDGVALYASDDLAWLGELAHHVRTQKNGDRIYFNVNRHLNLTNVCAASCAYCSLPAQAGGEGRVHDAHRGGRRLAKAMEPDGITELHIVNGLHPTLPWRYYPQLDQRAKAALPERRDQGVHRHRDPLVREDLRAARPTRSWTS